MVVKTPFCIKICKKCGRLLVANTINFHKSKGKKYNKEMLDWYTQQPFFNEDRLGKIYEWIEYAKNKYKK